MSAIKLPVDNKKLETPRNRKIQRVLVLCSNHETFIDSYWAAIDRGMKTGKQILDILPVRNSAKRGRFLLGSIINEHDH